MIEAVRPLLGDGSKDVLLHLATGAPISTCQKMLCGAASPNVSALQMLLRSKNVDFATEALRAFVGADAPIVQQADAAQQLRQARRLIKELESRISQMGGA